MTIDQLEKLGTAAGIVIIAVMNRIDAYKAKKQRDAALAVAKDTQQVAKETAETTGAIHVLSNSNMEAQLRVVWLQAKQIADLIRQTGNPSAIADEVAKEAERAYNEHQAKQALVDNVKTETAVKTADTTKGS